MPNADSLGNRMKVLLVAALYNEGLKSRGCSYEYYNLLQSLERVVNPLVVFDFMEILQQRGRESMNQALLETITRECPSVTIVVPYTDQLIPEVMDEINRHTITVGYFFDDMWRIKYARFWANHFAFITTSDVNGPQKFREAGHDNVIYSPFACNHRIFVKKDLPKKYDVTFVGQYHPCRAWYLGELGRAGISVQAWGGGWKTERLSQENMVNVFNQSRINLNLSNSVSWDVRYLLRLDRPVRETLRAWRGTFLALSQHDSKVREQVKGRHFEINACGSFQLSYYVEGLERHYQIGDEIALYASPEELVEKVRYYLKHEDEREVIAQRGYERTLREHTMEQRLCEILNRIRPSARSDP
jgi:spore maturation protein CgeB